MLKKVTAVWSFLNVCLLAAGAVSIAFSLMWRKGDLLMNMTISSMDLNAGVALGILLVLTSFFSVPAVLQGVNNNSLLIALNWAVVADMGAATSVGSIIWFFSLNQRQRFSASWEAFTDAQRVEVENKFSCCGYWNGTTAGGFTLPDPAASTVPPFCANPVFAANQTGCVGPITAFTDPMLEMTFSTIYGFVIILAMFALATVCLVNERQLLVRFRKIDAKRGGSGFV